MQVEKTFGMLLRDARLKAGMSQRRLADALGMSQSGIVEWEKGTRSVRLRDVARIAEALGIEQSELWPVVHEGGQIDEEDGVSENIKLGKHGRVVGVVPIMCPKPHEDGPHQGALIVYEDGYKEIMCTAHDGEAG